MFFVGGFFDEGEFFGGVGLQTTAAMKCRVISAVEGFRDTGESQRGLCWKRSGGSP